ncbi:hypothetical protein EJ110_NYTH11632 [Nymphaea thermarum]|nr:hypothetical protein EJ110_NYTH11632 [Nymphaea thermarum]
MGKAPDFLVVAVPYNVTFDHEKAAKEVYGKFNTCLDMLYATGLPDADLSPSDVLGLPVYSVGHSNGALLQLHSGSYFSEMIPKANAVISYNNRPAAEAVQYFEQRYMPIKSFIKATQNHIANSKTSKLHAGAHIKPEFGGSNAPQLKKSWLHHELLTLNFLRNPAEYPSPLTADSLVGCDSDY